MYTAVAEVPDAFSQGTVSVMESSVPSGQANRAPVATPVDLDAKTPVGVAVPGIIRIHVNQLPHEP